MDPLQKFRQQIDDIDDQLITLLRDRCDIVAEVGEYKRSQGEKGAFIRPGREGSMLRRIYQTFAGSPFQPGAAVAIWRQIIAASTAIETPMTLHVLGDATSLTAWHARIYFGRFHPMISHTDTQTLLYAVKKDPLAIGVVPFPTPLHETKWWRQLAGHTGDMAVFAHIPFVHVDDTLAPVFAFGHVKPEPSDLDQTLFYLHLDAEASTDSLIESLEDAILLDSIVEDGTRHMCLSLPGYLEADSPEMQALANNPAVNKLVSLGQYPAPITSI